MTSQSPPQLKVKICCISSIEEALLAIREGATAIGLVGAMPSGPGIISDELIKEIASKIPSHIETFLLTSETTAEAIIAHHKRTRTTCIQIVDELALEEYKYLRRELPSINLVQVVHVIDENSITQVIQVSPFVDTILLDSGNPNLSIKELGGTGRTHNWQLSKKIKDSVSIPVYLAGGLHKDNIQKAVETVQPYGVDLCSGVRSDGSLNNEKLSAFFQALNNIKHTS